MRESRSYGSARGVAGDRYPYRDWAEATAAHASHTPSPEVLIISSCNTGGAQVQTEDSQVDNFT